MESDAIYFVMGTVYYPVNNSSTFSVQQHSGILSENRKNSYACWRRSISCLGEIEFAFFFLFREREMQRCIFRRPRRIIFAREEIVRLFVSENGILNHFASFGHDRNQKMSDEVQSVHLMRDKPDSLLWISLYDLKRFGICDSLVEPLYILPQELSVTAEVEFLEIR